MEKTPLKSRDAVVHDQPQPPRARHERAATTWRRHLALLALLLFFSWRGITHLIQDQNSLLNDFYNHKSYRARALKLLEKHPLIDGHNDLAIEIAAKFGNHIYQDNFTQPFEKGGMIGHVDLPRIDEGRYAGAFWSAFWLCPADPFDFSDDAYAPIVRATLHQLDLLSRLSTAYPTYFPPTTTSSAVLSAFNSRATHIAPFAIEGLHQIGNSYANLRLYHALGVRYATLNWNCHTAYSDAAVITFMSNGSSIPSRPLHGGISARGRSMIREMNRLGMIVDLSHVSADTMRDVLVGQHDDSTFPIDDEEEWTGSLAPPIFSHSSAFHLCPHPRNVRDSVLPLVQQRNSVVMVNFSPGFIACKFPEEADPSTTLPTEDIENATLERVVEHIMYIGESIGYAHVGIGSDFDGIESTPVGLEGVDKMPDLVARLLEKGVSERDVAGVVGGNVLRVWREVEMVSEELQKKGVKPAEDELRGLGA